MTALLLALPVLSLVLLAAHFVRAGSPFVAALPVAMLLLLAVRRRWAARLVQVVLWLGAFDWLVTLLDSAKWRLLSGQPVIRLVLILASVTVVTAASTLVFRHARLQRIYRTRAERISARETGA